MSATFCLRSEFISHCGMHMHDRGAYCSQTEFFINSVSLTIGICYCSLISIVQCMCIRGNNVEVKVSQADQQRAAGIFESLGLDLATAINIFIKKSIDEGGFPFEIKDPFYSEANQAELNRRFKKVANNQGIHSRQLSENED